MDITCSTCQGTGIIQKATQADALDRGRRIVAETAEAFGFTVPEMLMPSRAPEYVQARKSAAMRMRIETDLTWKAIGLLLGRRDHSTMINLVRPKKQRLGRG